MRLSIDVMGGDYAPQAPLAAITQLAADHPDWQLLAVALPETLAAAGAWPANVTPVACGSVMAMDEDLRSLMKKKDSSIWMATDLVKQGKADAVISAGSTGAQMAAATLLLGRIRNVERPAIGMVLPTLQGGRLLLDVGANADCTPQMLLQFAQMGAVYASQLLQADNPRVALLANGTEAHKGNKLTQAAYALIADSGLNFLGNREGRDILAGDYEVIVCDGMSGNIAIKSMEGAIAALMQMLKRELSANAKRKLGAALVRDGLRQVKRELDYQEYGGAPLLGVNGVSIVCHGSSQARALVAAAGVAADCVANQLVGKLSQAAEQAAEQN